MAVESEVAWEKRLKVMEPILAEKSGGSFV